MRFLAVAIAVPILLLAILLWLRSETVRAEILRNDVAASFQRRIDLVTLLSRLKDAETAQRGFMITRNPAFLSPYEPARRDIAAMIARVRRESGGGADRADFARIDRLAAAKLGELDRTIAVIRAGRSDAAQAIVATGRGRRYMDTLRRVIGAEVANEQRRLSAQQSAFETQRAEIVNTVIAGYVLFSAMLLVFLAVLWRFRNDRYRALVDAFESAERKSAILSATIDAILIVDADGNIAVVNAAATRMLGYPIGDLEGRPVSTIIDLGDDAGAFHDQVGMVDGRLTQSYLTDRSVLHSDGRSIPVDIAIGVMSLSDGHRLVLSLRDISDRKRIERMKDELVSTVSHELRTPLTSVIGSLGLLKSGAVGTLPADAGRLVDIAENNSRRLIRLINDMLDIDRIEAGKLTIVREPIDLRDAVDRACSGSEGLAKTRAVQIACDMPDRAVMVSGDADRLLQVITNLMSNAIRAAPEGSTIDLTLETWSADDAIVSVRDRGEGIPLAFRDRIFGRFERVDRDTSSGTGLGLAIAREIVARHDGRIWFEDRAGGGTSFCFSIAMLRGAAARDQYAPRILIAHRDDVTARALGTVVANEGCLYDIARDAAAVRAALEHSRYSAAIVDPGLRDAMGDTGNLPILSVVSDDDREAPLGDDIVVWRAQPGDASGLTRALHDVFARKRPWHPVILHVDADRDFLEVVAAAIGAEADVVSVTHLAAARDMVRSRPPVAVILDMQLGDGLGTDLLPLLVKPDGRRIPTMIYSTRDVPCDIATQVDAVLVKARGSIPELKATLRHIVRRHVRTQEQP